MDNIPTEPSVNTKVNNTVSTTLFGATAVEVEKKLSSLQNLILANKQNTESCKDLFVELENTLGYDDNDLVLLRVEIAKKNRQK